MAGCSAHYECKFVAVLRDRVMYDSRSVVAANVICDQHIVRECVKCTYNCAPVFIFTLRQKQLLLKQLF